MNILILGANSDIARATALELGGPDTSIHLVSRNAQELQKNASDLKIRTRSVVRWTAIDLTAPGVAAELEASIEEVPEVAVLAFGYLGDQQTAQIDSTERKRIIDTNFVAAVSMGEMLAEAMENKGRGTIVGIASVAGLRGRQSNYLYGAAKAGFIAYLSGLRHRLYSKGVHVVTVLPGFVATKMTAGMDLPAALTAEPEEVARIISMAIKKRRNVVYVKPTWRWIMLMIRLIPEWLFKRTRL